MDYDEATLLQQRRHFARRCVVDQPIGRLLRNAVDLATCNAGAALLISL